MKIDVGDHFRRGACETLSFLLPFSQFPTEIITFIQLGGRHHWQKIYQNPDVLIQNRCHVKMLIFINRLRNVDNALPMIYGEIAATPGSAIEPCHCLGETRRQTNTKKILLLMKTMRNLSISRWCIAPVAFERYLLRTKRSEQNQINDECECMKNGLSFVIIELYVCVFFVAEPTQAMAVSSQRFYALPIANVIDVGDTFCVCLPYTSRHTPMGFAVAHPSCDGRWQEAGYRWENPYTNILSIVREARRAFHPSFTLKWTIVLESPLEIRVSNASEVIAII